ncbi:hypothetical protein B0H14DRAFT_179894 [Mycena olivaceomarginata]|nr:hypothetical protein B0H14DRAFT_179894 [Mycena olivaceomarginata]
MARTTTFIIEIPCRPPSSTSPFPFISAPPGPDAADGHNEKAKFHFRNTGSTLPFHIGRAEFPVAPGGAWDYAKVVPPASTRSNPACTMTSSWMRPPSTRGQNDHTLYTASVRPRHQNERGHRDPCTQALQRLCPSRDQAAALSPTACAHHYFVSVTLALTGAFLFLFHSLHPPRLPPLCPGAPPKGASRAPPRRLPRPQVPRPRALARRRPAAP